MRRPIFLIGYMGSGKTTLGKAVAARASIAFIDLDEYVESESGMTVSEIFAAEGESGFRRRERAALEAVAARGNLLVACGGGTPCFFDNMDLMNSRGTTVLLQCPAERLAERLALQRSTRPLVASLDDDSLLGFITDNLEKRAPHYNRAAEVFDSSRLDDAEQVDESVASFITRFLDDDPADSTCT